MSKKLSELASLKKSDIAVTIPKDDRDPAITKITPDYQELGRKADNYKTVTLSSDGAFLAHPEHYKQQVAAWENLKNIADKYSKMDWSDPSTYLNIVNQGTSFITAITDAMGLSSTDLVKMPVAKDSDYNDGTEPGGINILNNGLKMLDKYIRSNTGAGKYIDAAKGIYNTLSSIFSSRSSEVSGPPREDGSIVQQVVGHANTKAKLYDRNSGNLYKLDSLTPDQIASKVLTGELPIANDSYRLFFDPYIGNQELSARSIQDIRTELESQNLLSGYKDLAGFEIGSNHNWRIKIRPYNSAHGPTCTPPLPVYILPGSIRDMDSSYSSFIEVNYDAESNSLIDGKDIVDKSSSTSKSRGLYYDPQDMSLTDGVVRYFSFSEHCPVLSYDLNFGTIKTENIPLFNGSNQEIFMGMNFNSMLNLSILDDVYNSMYKYMLTWLNCVYDVNTGSIAPYYSCAFEIELVIFRDNYQVNHHYKFIGIPVEFTPRLDGQQSPTECRVDMTFAISGLIPVIDGMLYSPKELQFSGVNFPDSITNFSTPQDQTYLRWSDIMIDMGSK